MRLSEEGRITLKINRWPVVENSGAVLALADLRAIVYENGELVVFKSYSASCGGLAEPASYYKSAPWYCRVSKAWQCMVSWQS